MLSNSLFDVKPIANIGSISAGYIHGLTVFSAKRQGAILHYVDILLLWTHTFCLVSWIFKSPRELSLFRIAINCKRTGV